MIEAFNKIDLRIGKIVTAEVFAKARKPAYKLSVDFGPVIGIKGSSAQLTFGYPDPSQLLGQLVVAVVNFAPRNIAGFMSSVLVTGFYADEKRVFLLQPATDDIPLGSSVLLEGKGQPAVDLKPIITFDDFDACKIVSAEDSVSLLNAEDITIGKLGVYNCEGLFITLITNKVVPKTTRLQ